MEVSVRIVTVIFCVLNAFKGIHGNLDITCINSASRVQVDGDDGYFIGGYLSGIDTDATITFERILRTYGTASTSQALPGESREASGGRIVRRYMRSGEGGQRVGAYYCDAEKNGIIERIRMTVMSKQSTINPGSLSYTASLGESLQLVVDVNDGITRFRWRKDGTTIGDWDHQSVVTIDEVTVEDGGIYECHKQGERLDKHAIFQVNIRECVSNKWNPPSCMNDCPICLNGGICDDWSGICVCPPGFRGIHCEEVHGSNRWGQSLLPDGTSIVCSSASGNDPHSTACDDSLFCLPHPYGCSCAAGFQGIDCDQQCTSGQFGAGCKQECHCAPDVSCLNDTGECDGGQCAEGLSGVNCQLRCTEPGELPGITMTSNENVLQIDWEPEQSICLDKQYIVEYELLQIFLCESFNVTSMETTTTSTSIDITVLHNAQYAVYIKTRLNGTYISERQFGRSIRTDQGVPDVKPVVSVTAAVDSTSLSYTWDPTPCESMGGDGHHYVYQLQYANGSVVSSGTTSLNDITFDNLTECTEYRFSVRTANNIGPGPTSEDVMTFTRTIPPGPINALMVDNTDDKHSAEMIAIATWLPTDNNCQETGYVINVQLDEIDQCTFPDNSNQNNYTKYVDAGQELMKTLMSDLIPYSTYSITVKANNSAGFGEEVSIEHITDISAPTAPPAEVTAISQAARIAFEWTEPPCGHRHGPITSYSYFLQDEAGDVIFNSTTQDMTVTLSELTPYTVYNFTIAASTDVGIGPFVTMTKKTLESRSSTPTSLKVDGTSTKSIAVSWSMPESPNGVITHYTVEGRVIGKSYDPTFVADTNGEPDIVKRIGADMPLYYNITNLIPSTEYEISVSAINGAGPGELSRIEESTKAATADDIKVPNVLTISESIRETSTTATIMIPKSTSEFVTSYQVGVQQLSNRDIFRREAPTYGHFHESPTSYIAGEIPKESSLVDTFVVGDDQIYGGYWNPPLQVDTKYAIRIGYVGNVQDGESIVAWSDAIGVSTLPAAKAGSDLYIIVIVVLVIVLLAVVAVVAAFNIKKRCMRSNTPSASNKQMSTNPTPPTQSMPSVTSSDKPIQMSTGDYVEYKPQKEGQYQDLNTGPVTPKYYVNVVDDDQPGHVVSSPVIGSDENPGEDYEDVNTYEVPE